MTCAHDFQLQIFLATAERLQITSMPCQTALPRPLVTTIHYMPLLRRD